MLHYSQGIVDTVAKDSLVDIFPWLQVDHNFCARRPAAEWNAASSVFTAFIWI